VTRFISSPRDGSPRWTTQSPDLEFAAVSPETRAGSRKTGDRPERDRLRDKPQAMAAIPHTPAGPSSSSCSTSEDRVPIMKDDKRAAEALDRVEAVLKADVITEESKKGTDAEHRTTVWEAVRGYPKAIAWSALFSVAVIMTGYDGQIITSFYAQPAFQRKYGYEYPVGSK
jgi:hypothetical protein